MRKFTFSVTYFAIASFIFLSCKKESLGLPDNLISTIPDSVLIAHQTSLFKEGHSVVEAFPVLFDSIHEKKIIMKSDAFVYVTFLYEGADWTNSLGYYSYQVSESPSIANKKILFPNISESGAGGALKPGDLVQVGLGIIPKGTVLSFYLVAKGWENGGCVDGIYTNYTDKIFNANHGQQSIIFVEKTTGKLVLGFEDMLINDGESDVDYNDIVVSISDSKDPSSIPTSFELDNIPIL